MAEKSSSVKPRIIIHGGAGNITRQNLYGKAYDEYRDALLGILNDAYHKLRLPGATALDVATEAVSHLENNGLFNSGHGAVFTREETLELEASVMVSRGYRKRGVGVMKVTKAKNPIKLAREMLIRGDEADGGGAQGHCQLEGETCNRLAEEWGLETVDPSYFWVRKRWDEHRRGLGKEHDDETYRRHKARAGEADQCHSNTGEVSKEDIGWDGKEYLPQGTVGAVVLDSSGTVCVATSTGGITNKLPGRIGDTPTLGAGFWAEEWYAQRTDAASQEDGSDATIMSSLTGTLFDCFPGLRGLVSAEKPPHLHQQSRRRAVAMSGTGNGDSFLRLNAVRTAAAISRFSSSQASTLGTLPLQAAVSTVAGPRGMLQQSAEDRWLKSGEGEGGIIGIDLDGNCGKIVFDFNCGGMFHAWIDDEGSERFEVFQPGT